MSDNLGMKEVAEGGVHLLAAGVAGLGPEVAVDAEIVDDGLGLTASDGGKVERLMPSSEHTSP